MQLIMNSHSEKKLCHSEPLLCHSEPKAKNLAFTSRFFAKFTLSRVEGLRMTKCCLRMTRAVGITLSFLIITLTLVSCAGSSKKAQDPDVGEPVPGPVITPGAEGSISQIAENTFIENGISISVDPLFLDFGGSKHQTPVIKPFTVNNNTDSAHSFLLDLQSQSGSFSLMEDDGSLSAYRPIRIEAGTSQGFNLRYDAAILGTHSGQIEVTADGLTGHIIFPFRGSVTSTADMKLIHASYMCSNNLAPVLNKIDFGRVASGRFKKNSFKICNIGDKTIKIHLPQIKMNTTGAVSDIIHSKKEEPPLWSVTDALNPSLTSLIDYPSMGLTEPFAEPAIDENTPGPASEAAAFSIEPLMTDGTTFPPQGLTMDAGSYVHFDVFFSPNISHEPPDGGLYSHILHAADIDINTSIGHFTVDAVGATGGREPMLELTYLREEDTAAARKIKLNSPNRSINFGTAKIYSDWVTEHARRVKLVLKNVGSGNKKLKIWFDDITQGYFTFESNQEVNLPIELAPGERYYLNMLYAPAPVDRIAVKHWNLGQLVIRHNGGNGPVHYVTLVGEQTAGNAVLVMQGASIVQSATNNLDKNGELKVKNFCAVKINDVTDPESEQTVKDFTIINNSPNFTLTSTLSVTRLTDENGLTYPAYMGRATISPETVLTIPPKSQKDFDLSFFVHHAIKHGKQLNGEITITNRFSGTGDLANPQQAFGTSLDIYRIPFTAQASTTGECDGASGVPLDGTNTFIIDRITMNLLGLDEPARNPPSFKFHLPIDLNLEHGSVRIHGLPFNPAKPVSYIKQIRSYAHQISNVNSCYPLPTNPYKLEFEEGSWDGPGKQCNYTSEIDPDVKVLGSAVCMASNDVQEEELDENGTKEKVYVFYHEFVKFGKNCNVDVEGKVSTFFLRQGETPGDVFDRMQAELDITSKNEDDYAQYTRPYSFGSYIMFNKSYNGPGCNVNANTKLEDPDQIKACWKAFVSDEEMRRVLGMVEECSYFNFEIGEGCYPQDAPEVLAGDVDQSKVCTDTSITIEDPDTWKGYGKYEVDPVDDKKYDITIYNTNLKAFTLVHSLNVFFLHAGKLLYSDLYGTLTTKAIGKTDDPYELVAVDTRSDFEVNDILRNIDEAAIDYWIEEGVNSQFKVGENGEYDDRPCVEYNSLGKFEDGAEILNYNECRGNFEFTDQGQLVHAGESIGLDYDNRLLVVALSAFHGPGELAPSFASENSAGKGKALFFSFHGCLKRNEVDENGDFIPFELEEAKLMGCYDGKIDDRVWNTSTGNNEPIINAYLEHGLLDAFDVSPEPEEGETIEDAIKRSKAYINFEIFDDDRNRLNDYYNYFEPLPPLEFDHNSLLGINFGHCGYGM
jgi:hypothetical protein